MVSEAHDEMKHAFINTQSNTISNRNLARRPVYTQPRRATVKRVLGANVHDTGREHQSAAVGGRRAHGERPKSRNMRTSLRSAPPKWPVSSDLAGVVRFEHRRAGNERGEVQTHN